MKKFEFLEHTADIKFRAYGSTLNEAFENSVIAMVSYIVGDENVLGNTKKIVRISGTDYESLLYKLFDEILFLLDSERFITAKSHIEIKKFSLKAELYGDDAKNYSLDHIKAATYAEMYIKKIPDETVERWEIQAVLDV